MIGTNAPGISNQFTDLGPLTHHQVLMIHRYLWSYLPSLLPRLDTSVRSELGRLSYWRTKLADTPSCLLICDLSRSFERTPLAMHSSAPNLTEQRSAQSSPVQRPQEPFNLPRSQKPSLKGSPIYPRTGSFQLIIRWRLFLRISGVELACLECFSLTFICGIRRPQTGVTVTRQLYI
ncbi:hypothetical protein CPB85DRAFT_586407 [Mucidula mucida]|nr:hypothetical protein CPB85DRAFT_586407 [Mucidula mucida]